MNKTKPTLVILAAGIGSRYGGLKQLDTFSPQGDTILDFSIYDALRAGFGGKLNETESFIDGTSDKLTVKNSNLD